MSEHAPEERSPMTPEQTGKLLLRWVTEGRSFSAVDPKTGDLVREDFSNAKIKNAALSGANLRGIDLRSADLSSADLTDANLSGSDLRSAELWGVELKGASLTSAVLEHAILGGSRLEGTNFSSAILSGANLSGAHCIGTNLQWAEIDGVDLMHAYLCGANLSGDRGRPADCRQTSIDAKTYARSQWTPAHLSEWLKAGAVIKRFEDFPPDARARVLAERQGLLLRFKTALSERDRLAIDLLIVSFKDHNPGSDLRVVDYTEHDDGGHLRLCASESADLLFIGLILYQRIWEKQDRALAPRASEVSKELTTLSSSAMLRQLSWLVSRGERFEVWTLSDGDLKKTEEWTLERTRESMLHDLLLSLYVNEDDFFMFLKALPDATGLRAHLPGEGRTLATLTFAAVDALEARGLIDEIFFLSLVRERPRRIAEIACAARAWGVEIPPVIESMP